MSSQGKRKSSPERPNGKARRLHASPTDWSAVAPATSPPPYRRGTGARSRVLIVLLALSLGALFAIPAAAFAAAPEAPEITGTPPSNATEVTVVGVLDPGRPAGEEGLETFSYEFFYRESATECTGGSATSPETSNGNAQQRVFGFLSGLTPGTNYTVCLVATNGEGSSTSAPTTFTTPIPPETPEAKAATAVTATTATLNGIVNPSGPGQPNSEFFFRYRPSATECEGEGALGSAPSPSPEGEAEPVSTSVTGLLPATTYSVCLFVSNSGGQAISAPGPTFTTPTASPLLEGASVASLDDQSATLRTTVNPGGLPTTVRAEYISEAQFALTGWAGATSLPQGGAQVAAAKEPVAVLIHLAGLAPESGFRFRFVAENGDGRVTGTEATFATTATESSSTLPDGRVYERVSNSGIYGESYIPTPAYQPAQVFHFTTRKTFQASSDGEAIAYIGEPGITGGNGEVGPSEGNQWIAVRTAEGWRTEPVYPLGSGGNDPAVFQAFPPSLSNGLVQVATSVNPSPSGPTPCDEGSVLDRRNTASGAYTPLITESQEAGCGRPLSAGESADGSQVLLQTEAALTPGAASSLNEFPPGHGTHAGGEDGEPCMFGCNLYVSSGGHLQLVNVLPGPLHEVVPNATFGGFPGASASEPSDRTNFSGAISNNGDRIYWTDTQPGPQLEHVYVLEDHTEEVQVSGPNPAEYWAASPDGRFAYYTEGGQLWRFDSDSEAREALTSAGAGVLGVIGTNQTGSAGAYLYLVAEGILAGNSVEHGGGEESAVAGEPNLYLIHEGIITFISTLSPDDNGPQFVADSQGPDEDRGDWTANLGSRTAELTPDGTHLVFQSVNSLTGYNNHVEGSSGAGSIISEVFLYDAATGAVRCASCDPGGKRPTQPNPSEFESQLPVSSEAFSTMRRWVSREGTQVFFNSSQPLVAPDQNGRPDVYEWEAEGHGTCISRPVPRPEAGCVGLISGSESSAPSFLVETDQTGRDVFFVHRGDLGSTTFPRAEFELYDARENGGFTVGASTQCGAAACGRGEAGQAPGPPQGSESFVGHGNVSPPKKKQAQKDKQLQKRLKACRKKKGKARATCERNARRSRSGKGSKQKSKKNSQGGK